MCRPLSEGGRRCAKHNEFGRLTRNLQARKQYHLREGNQEAALKAAQAVEALQNERDALIADGGTLHPHTMHLTPNTERILAVLNDAGFDAYIVGGSVRDELFGTPSKDVDIEVYKADAESLVSTLKQVGKVDEVGKSFGVIKIMIDDEDYDISMPRIDSKTAEGHTGFEVKVDPDLSLMEATARRDFTMNALMYDHKLGYIIDKHGGIEDVNNRKLRHVSDAFDEDPLRVLRGAQMAARFGMDLDESTVKKAETLKDAYGQLATERVQVEFEKLYTKSVEPEKGLQVLQDTGWDEKVPGLKTVPWDETKQNLSRACKITNANKYENDNKIALMSATVVQRMNDKDARTFLSHTVVGNKVSQKAFLLSRMETPALRSPSADVKEFAFNMKSGITVNEWCDYQESVGNPETADSVRSLARKEGVLTGIEKVWVNGDDLLAKYPDRKPGAWMRDALNEARRLQYNREINTREELLKRI